MDLAAVMDELGTALATIDGLRAHPYAASRISPPAALVTWPEEITYDLTMGRGSDRMTPSVLVLVSATDARSARGVLAAYLNGSGDRSVKAALESYEYTTCDTVTVVSARVDDIDFAGTTYLGAVFALDVTGTGA